MPSSRKERVLTFSPMPEMATGLTNLLIIVSALWCLSALPASADLRLWRLFFCSVAFAAACGAAVHCLVLPEAAEHAVWALFDLCFGPLLTSLAAAALKDVRGPLPLWATVLLLALAAVTSLGMILLLLKFGFRAQFPLAAAAAGLAMAVYLVMQLYGVIVRHRSRGGLLGLGIILLAGLTWLLGDFTVTLGPLQMNQVSFLHLGLALALPFFAFSAGPSRK